MKTPEELKESLDACFEKRSCATCHYAHSIEGGLCLADMGLDAKAYIEQLEAKMPDPSYEGGSIVKSPEELKKSMRLCFRDHKCTGCAYNALHCFGVIGADALAYIEQLEEQIDLMKIQMHGDCGVCKHRQEGRAGYDIKAHKFHMPDHCTGCQTSQDRPNWEYEGLPEVKAR